MLSCKHHVMNTECYRFALSCYLLVGYYTVNLDTSYHTTDDLVQQDLLAM